MAAYLRLDGLGVPSYWLDEILHQQLTTAYAALPWWRWLGRLHEEHAGLYYLTQLATGLFGTSEGAARAAAALFGIATVPLAWLVSWRTGNPACPDRQDCLSSTVAAASGALLLAVSPLHVYFSREARSYALLTLLTAALVLVLLRARSLAVAGAVLAAMLYTSAVSATIVLSALAVAVACAFVLPERRRWYATVAAFCVVTMALFRVVYAARPVEDANWPGFPAVDAQFFASLLRTFSVSAFGTEIAGRTAVAMLLFAIAGAVALFRTDRRAAIVVAGMAFLPVAISLAVLKTLDHFYAPRYVMPAVFGYTVLAGIGIAYVARLPGALWSAGLSARHHDGLRARRSSGTVLAILIAIITAIQMWPSARAEPFRKLDWRGVAAVVASHARPDDVVMAAEPWSYVSLRWYLERHPRAPGVLLMPHVPLAERFRLTRPGAWIVTAGYDDSELRRWLCGFPMIAASPLENFRLHYASVDSDFLRERGRPAEFRAASPLNQVAFEEGWAQPEDDFRWAVGTQATLSFVNWGPRERVLRMRVLPSTPGQTMNSRELPDEWSEQRFVVPVNDGVNTVTFEFTRTRVPGGRDQRQLAAAFADVILDRPAVQPSLTRSAAGLLLDEHTGWRGRRIRVTGPFRRDQMLPLLARLGFDPEAVWPRLARGDLHIENLAETIAYGQDCADDETFLRLACALLLDRQPYDGERALAGRTPRPEMVRRIVRSDEFARRYVQGVIPSEVEESPADGTGGVHR